MILKFIFITLFYSVIALNILQSSPVFAQQADNVKKVLSIGDEAPKFVLRDLSGDFIYLRDYSGKKLRQPWKKREKHVVVVSFFATWCIPCKTEIPILDGIAAKFTDEPLKIYLVDLNEKEELVVPFIDSLGVSIPVLFDIYGVVAEKYGVVALPQTFLIDKEGTIRYLSRGLKDAEKFRSSIINNIETWINVEN